MKRHLGCWTMLGVALCLWTTGAGAAGTAGDADAKKLTKTAMEKSYMAGDFDAAVKKLNQAAALCQSKGCTPSVQAEIYASLAVVHWDGTEDTNAAIDDLRSMLKADPKYELDSESTPELLEALAKLKGTKPAAAPAASAAARPPAAAPAPAASGAAAQKPAAPAPSAAPKTPEEARKLEEFQKQVEARKVQRSREIDEAGKASEAAEAKRAADEKKAEEARKAEEAQKAAKDKEEAEKKAAEEKKAEEQRRVEEAKRAAIEKKEAAKKEAEEKKEAAKKAIEDKKEAAKKAIEDKKEAARKAAEEKKAEIARKAEEAAKKREEERLAKEEQRMKTPPPVGKLQETPWHEQTKGYPIPIYVKVPTPPRGIEKPRIEVVKVVTEYMGGADMTPKQVELKPLKDGGYGGLIPCDASMSEGEVSYFTMALNKYDNPVAGSGTRAKPNKVLVKPVFTGKFPHLPGELPPRVCKEDRGGKEASAQESSAKAAPTVCATNADCPDGTCTKEGCTSASSTSAAAPPLATPTPRTGGCAGCRLGASGSAGTFGSAALAALACSAGVARRRRRVSRAA